MEYVRRPLDHLNGLGTALRCTAHLPAIAGLRGVVRRRTICGTLRIAGVDVDEQVDQAARPLRPLSC